MENNIEHIRNWWWHGDLSELDYEKHNAVQDLISTVEELVNKQNKVENYLKKKYPKIFKEVYGE